MFRATFSFRTPVAIVCYDLWTEEKDRVFGTEFIMAKLRKYTMFGMKRVQEIVRNSDNHLLVIEQ
jgi:hypothetical protein